MREASVSLESKSSYYETSPVDYTDQPDFINNAIEIETDLDIDSLWRILKDIQQRQNREKTEPKGPRVIDLDILVAGDVVRHDSELTIPHMAICDRRFVLVPLLEIAPDICSPIDGTPYRTCLDKLDEKEQRVDFYHD
jgi:2-amino-4-hydroxy-6-hydroxymethyldihydropteridine diphosphokinase